MIPKYPSFKFRISINTINVYHFIYIPLKIFKDIFIYRPDQFCLMISDDDIYDKTIGNEMSCKSRSTKLWPPCCL